MTVNQALLRTALGRGGPAWLQYLVLCGVAVAAFLLLGPAPAWTLPHTVAYEVMPAVATAAIIVGIRRHRPERPLGWYLATAAMAVSLAADLIWYAPAARSLANVLSLAAYPVGLAALALLVWHRNPRRDHAALVDALVIGAGPALLYWAFVLVPFLRDPPPLGTGVLAVIVPAFDIALLALVTRLIASGRQAFALRIVLASLIILLVADTFRALQTVSGATGGPGVADVGWMAFFALLGAAALHPSMRVMDLRTIPPPARLTRVRVGVLVGVAVATPALLALAEPAGEPVSRVVLFGGSALLGALVVLRMTRLVGDERVWAGQQERLLDRTVEAVEQERGRIAADLHDGPIQRLTSVTLEAHLARRRLDRSDQAAVRRFLDEAQQQVGAEVRTLRDLVADLHAPELDSGGLEAAVRRCAAELGHATGIVCSVAVEQPLRLDPSRETVAYRVVQEALHNIAKHAQASTVEIHLRVDGETARLDVRDDGVGFAADTAENLLDQRHFGLVGMRQRVAVARGSFRVRSTPGHGTTITVHLPLPPGA